MSLSPQQQADVQAQVVAALDVLKERFGYERFLPGQQPALESVLAGRNTLAVMPTGSGKSLLYQLPALLAENLTLVVSPLIALMKDQVDELERKGVPATFVNSSLSFEEQRARLAQCSAGRIKLLYVAPERFRNSVFLSMLGRTPVSRMAVDEAHCISEWGHDFRPDYRRLKEFLQKIGTPPVTALTATATTRVQHDIIESLGLDPGDVDVHVYGFDRPNLTLEIAPCPTDAAKNEVLTELLQESTGPGIVYTGTRRSAGNLAESLRAIEPSAIAYHAGLDPERRTAAQEAFLTGKARVVVATTAFGMGIDKPDVRFVVHYQYPGSVEQYYQEIGRAGRDGLPSRCVLLYSSGDRFLREFFIDLNYPSPEVVEAVYEALWSFPENPILMTYREIARFCENESIKDGHVGAAVRLLDRAGVTRAFSGESKVGVTLPGPGAAIIEGVRGPSQRRVIEGLSALVDIETPGTYEVPFLELCTSAGLSADQARRALNALDADGHIGYSPPFRGRGIEKLVAAPPPFAELAIDWDHQKKLRQFEEDKLAAMEAYIHSRNCRRGTILRYFGERRDFQCGTCDNCLRGEQPRGAEGVTAVDDPELATAILLCVKHLRFPVGKARIAQVLGGSRQRDVLQWGLDGNPMYGTIKTPRKEVRRAVDQLVRSGLLEQQGEANRPVLALTEDGREVIEDLDAAQWSTKTGAQSEKPGITAARSGQPESEDHVRHAVLRCVNALPRSMGAGRVAAVLAGSKAKWIGESGADDLEVYGCLSTPRARIQEVIASMVDDGLLRRSGGPYPILSLTRTGETELAALKRTGPAPEAVPAASPPPDAQENGDTATAATENAPPIPQPAAPGTNHGDPRDSLDLVLDHVLTGPSEEAKLALPDLGVFQPSEIVSRLEAVFLSTQDARVQARAVWLAGELGERHAVPFLVRTAQSDDGNIRRLSASALGKVSKSIHAMLSEAQKAVNAGRRALENLVENGEGQTVRYAQKALATLNLCSAVDAP